MLRDMNRDHGMVHVLGVCACTATKTRDSSPKRIMSTMMRALPQAYMVSPHCSASSRHTIAGTNVKKLGMSSWSTSCS